MLAELSNIQQDSEESWDCVETSFTIQTRSDDTGELVKRMYTFSHAPEWDKWAFTEFEEYHGDRLYRHVMWHDAESPTISVPPEVTKKLEALLELNELTLQMP